MVSGTSSSNGVFQVHALHQKGGPIEPTGHDAQIFSSMAEVASATTTSKAQQGSRDASSKDTGSVRQTEKYSEEHEQAINTLSALWPPEVPLDKAFLESVLDAQCQGNLEVHHLIPCWSFIHHLLR